MPDKFWLAGARFDYAEAYAWYATQSTRAAEGFEREMANAIDAITSMPTLWPPLDERHRFYVLNRYPYSVIYRADLEKIIIVAIAHSSRNPSYWQERGV